MIHQVCRSPQLSMWKQNAQHGSAHAHHCHWLKNMLVLSLTNHHPGTARGHLVAEKRARVLSSCNGCGGVARLDACLEKEINFTSPGQEEDN